MHSHTPLPSILPADVPDGAPILDVREQDEWDAGHIAWAQHLPMSDLASRADEISVPADGPLIVACHVGGRSSQVVAWLRSQGVNAVNLMGGLDEWAAAGRPIV